jgi:opacity protein-like surface antigen
MHNKTISYRMSAVLVALGCCLPFLSQVPAAVAQGAPSPSDPTERRPESELALVTSVSVGHYRIFGYDGSREIYPLGLEYDRHIFGGLLGARVDYVAEVLPVLLLNEPANYAVSGAPLTTRRQVEYGAGLSPVGARLLWRRNQRWKPYIVGKGGVAYFTQRVLSTEGTHLNFTAEFGGGVEARIAPRLDLRAGYGIFHVSNGDIGRHNPGLDVSSVSFAVGYRFGRR